MSLSENRVEGVCVLQCLKPMRWLHGGLHFELQLSVRPRASPNRAELHCLYFFSMQRMPSWLFERTQLLPEGSDGLPKQAIELGLRLEESHGPTDESDEGVLKYQRLPRKH